MGDTELTRPPQLTPPTTTTPIITLPPSHNAMEDFTCFNCLTRTIKVVLHSVSVQ